MNEINVIGYHGIWTLTINSVLVAHLIFTFITLVKLSMLELKFDLNMQMQLWVITFNQHVIYCRPHLNT